MRRENKQRRNAREAANRAFLAAHPGYYDQNDDDDGHLDPQEFDADAGRDVLGELDYVRSGREKRNFGC